MKSWTLNGIVLAVCCALIVQAEPQCGDLGAGKNPCSCSETVVKAAKLPTPTVYASPELINDAAVARNTVIQVPVATPTQTSYSESVVYSNGNGGTVESAPVTYDVVQSAPVTYDVGKSAPVTYDVVQSAPVTYDVGKSAPVTYDVVQSAPVTYDVVKSAPVTYDVVKSAPATYDVVQSAPVTYDVVKPAPATYDVVKSAPVTYDVVKSAPATYNVVNSAPVTYDVVKSAPVTYDVVKSAPATYNVVKSAPVTYDVVKSAPATYDVVKSAPATYDMVKSAPVTYDMVKSAPVTYDVVKSAPATYDVVKSAPVTYDVVKSAPATYDMVKSAPATYDVVQSAPVTYDVVQSAPVTYDVVESAPSSCDGSKVYTREDTIVYNKGKSVSRIDTAVPVDVLSKPGCSCQKQNVETLELDAPVNPSGNVVPRFSPVGDLCYPLDIDSRSGKLIEKATVIPANPGKVVCNSCTVTPYEVCVNAQTGETMSRALVASSPVVPSGTAPVVFGKANVVAPSVATTVTTSNVPRLGLLGNLNSGIFAAPRSGTVEFARPSSGVYNLPRLLYAAAGSNAAKAQTQFSEVTRIGSFSDCDTDEIVEDSYPEVPADAVSLTLAYQNLRAPNVIYRQGKQFVPEDKLSFGHRTVPSEVKPEKKVATIAEEKLVTVEKPVVELKIAPPRTVVIGSYDEREEAKLAELEAIERESIMQEENADLVTDSLLTYRDLGYAPVGSTIAKSSYAGIINREIIDGSEPPCGPLGPAKPDYVPGSVVVQRELVGNLPAIPTAAVVDVNPKLEIQTVHPSPRFAYYKQRF